MYCLLAIQKIQPTVFEPEKQYNTRVKLDIFRDTPNLIRAQTNLCGFDGSLQQLEIDYPEIIQIMNANEAAIQEMINNNHQAIMNHDVYIIPVVFHVIHLGEPVGLGSNISDAQIYQGLADLNNYFRDVPGLGNDVEIAFCLAQRDPAGNLSTGINRVNGYGVGNYQNIGIASGNNETTIKALSIWPNTEYLNIWVVHYIAGPSGTTTLGNAYFPGAPPAIDGITLRYDAVGEPGNSAVIAHEAGHFLSLYHTFQGGTTTSCPPSPNNNCQLDGDHVCDTPPHKLVYGGCNVTGTNDCDNNTSNALVIHNYMSYSDNSCLHEFTMGQVERMRSALITQRSSLITSLGCEPGCTTTVANFTVSPLEVPAGTTLQFDNASSSNADTFIWRINGLEITNNEDLNYTFTNGGVFEVCLDAFGPNCVNRRCTTITVYPTCVTPVETCEKVWNGDFEQITSSAPSGWGQGFKAVCYWKTTLSSPFFCNKPDNNSIGLFALPKDEEKITSQFPLNLDTSSECTISFDYILTNSALASIIISLTEVNDSMALPNNATIIAQVDTPAVDYPGLGVSFNHMCYPDGATFHHYTGAFTYNGDGQLFLNVSGISFPKPFADEDNPPIFFIDNISINCCPCTECCNPVPDFEYVLEDCSVTFTGINTGDEGEYHWDFGDGSTAVGPDVTHEYIFGGTFPVCLTILCPDQETSVTTCKEITIPNDCNECVLLNPITASICESTETGPNKYLANFSFEVTPKGFRSCKPDQLFIWSPDIPITVTSFDIDQSNLAFDLFEVAIQLTPPAGTAFPASGVTVYITLCNGEGQMICREIHIDPKVCDNCMDEVHSEAHCIDTNSSDDVFIYSGSVTITLSSAGTPCGALSPLSGFEANFTPISATVWSVTYQIITTNKNLMHTTALLCFIGEFGERICIPLDITIIPCTSLPEECVAEWSPKNMSCTGEENGYYVFNISKSVYAGPYELCEGGLFGTVDGDGTVVINSATVQFSVFSFNIDIRIPVGSFVDGQVYNLKLYLCDHLGNIVCYYFPFRLFCDGFDSGSGARVWDRTDLDDDPNSTYTILPNPAKDMLMIVTNDFSTEIQREVRLMDQLGRITAKRRLISSLEEMDVTEQLPGVYLVAISEDGVPVKIEKIVILR